MDKLADFIQKQSVMTEAGLIIASEEAAEHAAKSLQAHGYHHATTLPQAVEFMEAGQRVYMHHARGDFNMLYKFIVQYPQGMVQFFGTGGDPMLVTQSTTPGFVLIISPAEIKHLETEGFDLLARTGLAFRA
ncbi:MAG TPA: hypothetical protein VLF67_01985 [Candidatus Saccharimonas sp.]|nr:hypothetical protein [Candidatus Saccharimonas sp.]